MAQTFSTTNSSNPPASSWPWIAAVLFIAAIAAGIALWIRPRIPIARPGAPVHVELPDNWEPRSLSSRSKNALQFAAHSDPLAYFEIVAQPKGDFAKRIDLMEWARLVKKNSTATSKLVDRTETDLTQGEIAGHPTVEYEIEGESGIANVHFRIIMLEFNNHYCKLVCWTTQSNWEASQRYFVELVSHLK